MGGAQLTMRKAPATWGGGREGGGRKVRGRARWVQRCARPEHPARFPVHVTMRVRTEAAELRSDSVFPVVRRALAKSSKDAFRLLHFSVQHDHVHLIVEASDKSAL